MPRIGFIGDKSCTSYTQASAPEPVESESVALVESPLDWQEQCWESRVCPHGSIAQYS